MRIMIKGGVWKNTEDEILKAAVMKYGKNQWARISSLLVRKSAKQCKARWSEWLDPSIKKTEWSREEEEKLLHLAKLMPCQWRSIAPIVGRTAAQCLEHYEKLLDQAQDKEDGVDAQDDPRRLRPGEIDPNPESKPARPDPVDMDEDEKEMLSEARARLANTQGKKAKRKAREKQLEEARRIASLQKRRELKAAGIDLPKYRRKRGVDYISEVPFERKQPAGFFSAEKEGDEEDSSKGFKKISLEGLEGKRRDKQEDEDRKRDKKRQKTKQEKNMPAAVMEINKLNDAEQVRKRSKLVLGAPQVNEQELEEIAKLQERGMAPIDDDEGNAATRTLMGDYADRTPSLAGRTPMRTPRSEGDMLRQEAQNLIALNHQAESSLKGGSNTPLHDSDFSGATPKQRTAQTPNPIATPLRAATGTPGRGGATPVLHTGSRMTPSSTPLRDQLGLNEEADAAIRSREQSRALKDALTSLPSAKNEYQILAPEFPADETTGSGMHIEEDAADVAEREAGRMKAREKQAMKERSTPLKRKLPRPVLCEEQNLVSSKKSQASDPEYLLEKEMFEMVQDDGVRFPVRLNQADDPAYVLKSKSCLPYYDPDQLAVASNMLKEELVELLQSTGVTKEDDAALWEAAIEEFVYVPQRAEYCFQSKVTSQDIQGSYSELHNELKQQMTKEAKKANKMEKKLHTLTAGYQKRAQQLLEEIQSMHAEQETKSQELDCFKALKGQEEAALPLRISTLKEDVELAKKRESQLQSLYKEKKEELSQLRA